jgi:hypothetical protein
MNSVEGIIKGFGLAKKYNSQNATLKASITGLLEKVCRMSTRQ